MRSLKTLTPVVAASVLAVSGITTTITAQAEAGLSADVSVASMYLWRGQDASKGPAVSGSLGWDSGAGFYAKTWVTSGYQPVPDVDGHDPFGGYEWDVWAGYAGEASGVSYDVSVWQIMYPQGSTTDSPDGLQAGTEISLGLGYQDFSFSYTINSGERYAGYPDYSYITLGYKYGDFGFKYGMQNVDATDADWSHIDVSYALGEHASVTVSKASYEADGNEEDPLILFSYTMPLDLAKK